MSKQSLRNEIDKLQTESHKILSNKSLPKETKFFIHSMLTILTVVVTLFLEKKTRKNSSNSGLPPSQDFGSNGNRNKERNQTNERPQAPRLDNVRDTESSETVTPTECSGCGTDLKGAPVVDTEERKEIDIVYERHEHTVIVESKECPDCGQENIAEFPQGMNGPLQYGIGIKAAIINFLCFQMLPLKRVQDHFTSLIGRVISPATMLKYVTNFSETLEFWEQCTIDQALKAGVMHIDETSMRVNKKTFWVHTYSCGDLVLQFIHPSRGRDAINDIGILERYGGVIVHDCWAPYFTYEHLTHALCLAHILRELKFIEDSTGDHWATNLKKLLQDAIALVNKRKTRVLTKKEYKRLQRRYRNILTRALSELPKFPADNGGKKGRPKHTDAQNLWLRLKEYESEVLLFACKKEVDPTNNRSERDLRMTKVKQKVSGCFRTYEMARHFFRITSYLKTMRNKGYSSLEAITISLKGEIPM